MRLTRWHGGKGKMFSTFLDECEVLAAIDQRARDQATLAAFERENDDAARYDWAGKELMVTCEPLPYWDNGTKLQGFWPEGDERG